MGIVFYVYEQRISNQTAQMRMLIRNFAVHIWYKGLFPANYCRQTCFDDYYLPHVSFLQKGSVVPSLSVLLSVNKVLVLE